MHGRKPGDGSLELQKNQLRVKGYLCCEHGRTSVDMETQEVKKVYVAVKAELKDGEANLLWAIHNIARDYILVLVHVHQPAQMSSMLRMKFPWSFSTQGHYDASVELERERINKSLDEYCVLCSKYKVRVEKVVIERDSVAKALVDLIGEERITEFVMGAAADNHYLRRMNKLKSKTAITVKQQADPSCKIYFVCKGNLITVREVVSDESEIVQPPSVSSSCAISQHEQPILNSLSTQQLDFSENSVHNQCGKRSLNSYASADKGKPHCSTSIEALNCPIILDTDGNSTNFSEGCSRISKSSSVNVKVNESENIEFSPPCDEEEVLESDAGVYKNLEEALNMVEILKNQVHEESCRRKKAETRAISAIQKAYEEVGHREEIEEALAHRELELEKLKDQLDEKFEQLQQEKEQKLILELRIAEYDYIAKDSKDEIFESSCHLHLVQPELERKDAVENIDKVITTLGAFSLEFSYLELEQATSNFSEQLKIGEGGLGSVYKGFMRNTDVAIKLLHQQSIKSQYEFHQLVAILSRVRHPSLVTLIGACSDGMALIYEFLPNGSLEDHLACTNNSMTIAWQVRVRIIAEVCSALIFLHSNKPYPLVHGDLRPANILLDANSRIKLSDYGIFNRLVHSNRNSTQYSNVHPKGLFAYVDREFLSTGKLTPESDVYSFGIIILRLLTGKPALGIVKEVQEALDGWSFHAMIDPFAGNWPFAQVIQLAHLGLRCCNVSRKNRPDLGEIWRVVEPMMIAASSSGTPLSAGSTSKQNNQIPSYFICPIFQEIMKDPYVAADGFTYEAEAISGWIYSGHDTSPMTNLKLLHCELIPNLALRSTIQEWQQQQQKQQQ